MLRKHLWLFGSPSLGLDLSKPLLVVYFFFGFISALHRGSLLLLGLRMIIPFLFTFQHAVPDILTDSQSITISNLLHSFFLTTGYPKSQNDITSLTTGSIYFLWSTYLHVYPPPWALTRKPYS